MRPWPLFVLVFALLVAALWLTTGTSATVSAGGGTGTGERDGGVHWTTVGDGVSPGPTGLALGRADDAGPRGAVQERPRPPARTGRATRAVTEAICSRAAAFVCRVRAQAGCSPSLESSSGEEAGECRAVVAHDCPRWAARRYDWVPDDAVIDDDAVRGCFAELEAQAAEGQPLWVETYCQWLVRDPAREGEPCTVEGPCGANGLCREGRCWPLPTEGEPCGELPCSEPLVCEALLCARATPEGGACDADTVCDVGSCVDGRCARDAPTCAWSGNAACPRGERCNEHDVCEPAEEACHGYDDCGSGFVCEGDDVARCVSLDRSGDVGGRCNGTTRCPTGTECRSWIAHGRCVPELCAQPDPFGDYGEE